MKKQFIFLILITWVSLVVGQSHGELEILESLKSELQANQNLSEIKLFHTKYDNGKSKELCLGVKYKTDSIDRWWQVGPSYNYSKNGQLRRFYTSDVKTNILCDSSIIYEKDGNIRWITYFPDTCTTFEKGLSVVNNQKDTLYSHFPNHVIERRYKYKSNRLSSIGTFRKTMNPRSKSLHGIQEQFDYKNSTIKYSEYDNGVLVTESLKKL